MPPLMKASTPVGINSLRGRLGGSRLYLTPKAIDKHQNRRQKAPKKGYVESRMVACIRSKIPKRMPTNSEIEKLMPLCLSAASRTFNSQALSPEVSATLEMKDLAYYTAFEMALKGAEVKECWHIAKRLLLDELRNQQKTRSPLLKKHPDSIRYLKEVCIARIMDSGACNMVQRRITSGFSTWTPLDALILKEERYLIWKTVLDNLEGHVLKTVLLYFVAMIPMQKIGSMMGYSESHISQLIKEGLGILRAKFPSRDAFVLDNAIHNVSKATLKLPQRQTVNRCITVSEFEDSV